MSPPPDFSGETTRITGTSHQRLFPPCPLFLCQFPTSLSQGTALQSSLIQKWELLLCFPLKFTHLTTNPYVSWKQESICLIRPHQCLYVLGDIPRVDIIHMDHLLFCFDLLLLLQPLVTIVSDSFCWAIFHPPPSHILQLRQWSHPYPPGDCPLPSVLASLSSGPVSWWFLAKKKRLFFVECIFLVTYLV